MTDIVNAVLIHENAVLLVKRNPHRRAYADMWSFPGGHVEAGELTEEALVRELREEIGIIPTDHNLIGTISDPNCTPDQPTKYHMYAVRNCKAVCQLCTGTNTLGWFGYRLMKRSYCQTLPCRMSTNSFLQR